MKDRKTLNKEMFEDTMEILKRGYYEINGKRVMLQLNGEEMKECEVFLPDTFSATKAEQNSALKTHYSCINTDSYTAAIECRKDNVLVLNFANAIHPGGGVLNGAKAQEEDLCRKSSLYLSLISPVATKYYQYNRLLNTNMGSDALILTPKVEIIKNQGGNLLSETAVVAVLTCAAPDLYYGYEGKSEEEYRKMVYQRICVMLECAEKHNYQTLVLGAWGCGAFHNDPAVISDLFYEALQNHHFEEVIFAVLDNSEEKTNFREFCRNFGSGSETTEEEKKDDLRLDKVRGCLLGGAVGDALGYPVEFLSEGAIFQKYGKKGITEYELDHRSGKALISDDTQMTLFTACGILIGDTRGKLRGIMANPSNYVEYAYLDWLRTQEMSYEEGVDWILSHDFGNRSWLSWRKEFYSRRAPGNTCLSALYQRREIIKESSGDYIENPLNHSKGCGGIMRVAPLALRYGSRDCETVDEEGTEIAAITHGHSLGYLPAAVLTHILHRIVYTPDNDSLKEIVLDARDTVKKMYADDPYIGELTDIINLAVQLSENDESDLDNIHEIGEGWVAEETLGIALYCALRYQNDFSKGVIAAVNHKGDSDSTGAVTGNILGALLGFGAIEEKWKKDLELYDVIMEMSSDLYYGCQMSEYSTHDDERWLCKYVYMCDTEEQRELQENTFLKKGKSS